MPVQYAVFLDQQGSRREASSILEELIAGFRPEDVNGAEHPYLGYAMARYTVGGGPCHPDARVFLHADVDGAPQNAALIRLGDGHGHRGRQARRGARLARGFGHRPAPRRS
jgi:hypothetical protein